MTLRVVQLNCVIDDGGRDPEALLAAWPTLPAIAGATARAGAEVTVIQASRTLAEVRQGGVTYRFVVEPRWRKGRGAGMLPWRLAEAVRRARPDIVHFNGLDFPFHVRAVCGTGVPVLVQDHASRPDGRIARFRGWGHARIAGAAFTARAQAVPFLTRGQLPAKTPVFAIPESSSSFTPGDREAARRETGVFGDPALLWVGHLDANKDPLTILRAVQAALPALPGLRLWCAFVGTALLPEIERMLREDPALAACVHLLGPMPHARIETLCRACDFYVSASRRESTGYALLEGLACGLPPIVSDIPAFGALTGEGAVGALVPPGDARGFAAAMTGLACEPRAELRKRTLRHFERHLSLDQVGARLVEAYAALAGAPV